MQAVTARARILESTVEKRAKDYGVPVDEYKSKITDIASDVIEKGQNAVENLQAKTRSTVEQGEKKVSETGEYLT